MPPKYICAAPDKTKRFGKVGWVRAQAYAHSAGHRHPGTPKGRWNTNPSCSSAAARRALAANCSSRSRCGRRPC
eukprot:6635892-Prymnesium_polylepis.1